MNAKITVTGLDAAEKNAIEILEHIDAIKVIQAKAGWQAIYVSTDLSEEKK